MRRVFAATVVASALSCCLSSAAALSFGQVSNATRLGQPLDFSVALKLDADEALTPDCLFAEVSPGDNRLPAAQVRTRLVRSALAVQVAARVSTTVRIQEPVVTVTVTAGCPPKLSHKFVSLLDPPSRAAAAVAVKVAPRIEAPKPQATAAAPVATLVAAPSAAQAAAPAASDVTITPVLSDAEQRDRDREHMLGLEERLERTQVESRETQQAIAALQARLRDAESARANDPQVYGLWTVIVLLLVAVGVLLWRQLRLQRQHAWLKESQALAADLGPSPSQAHRMTSTVPVGPDARVETDRDVTVNTLHHLSDPVTQGPMNEPEEPLRDPSHTTVPAAARVRHELPAEAVIDLEQQADFFIALGQEESAIDLLMGHVRSSGGTSPMPYLKLLEIYRRRGESEAYERIRERFNRRFNGNAPGWAIDPAAGRKLDGYPIVLARVQAVWTMPRQAADLLATLLFRRDSSQETFELAAYEELLFLYALSRELIEQDTNPDGVDLLLPLDSNDEVTAIMRAEATRTPTSSAVRPVDVELDLDSPANPAAS